MRRNAENVYLMTTESSDGKTRKRGFGSHAVFFLLMRGTVSSLLTAFHRLTIPFKGLCSCST